MFSTLKNKYRFQRRKRKLKEIEISLPIKSSPIQGVLYTRDFVGRRHIFLDFILSSSHLECENLQIIPFDTRYECAIVPKVCAAGESAQSQLMVTVLDNNFKFLQKRTVGKQYIVETSDEVKNPKLYLIEDLEKDLSMAIQRSLEDSHHLQYWLKDFKGLSEEDFLQKTKEYSKTISKSLLKDLKP